VARNCGPKLWPENVARECGPKMWPKIMARNCGPKLWLENVARKFGPKTISPYVENSVTHTGRVKNLEQIHLLQLHQPCVYLELPKFLNFCSFLPFDFWTKFGLMTKNLMFLLKFQIFDSIWPDSISIWDGSFHFLIVISIINGKFNFWRKFQFFTNHVWP